MHNNEKNYHAIGKITTTMTSSVGWQEKNTTYNTL